MTKVYGMGWYVENKSLSLKARIEQAAAYYRGKYGQEANVCHVHPDAPGLAETKIDGMEIKPDQYILPNNLWIGTV